MNLIVLDTIMMNNMTIGYFFLTLTVHLDKFGLYEI